jgi:hypothetical protein
MLVKINIFLNNCYRSTHDPEAQSKVAQIAKGMLKKLKN